MYLLQRKVDGHYKLQAETYRLLERVNKLTEALAELELERREKETDGSTTQKIESAPTKRPTNSRAKKATAGVDRPERREVGTESVATEVGGMETAAFGEGEESDNAFGGRSRYPTPTIISIPLGTEN